MKQTPTGAELLRWYVDAGVDEAIQDVPVDRYVAAQRTAPPNSGSVEPATPTPAPPPGFSDAGMPPPAPPARATRRDEGPAPGSDTAVKDAVALAAEAETVDALRAALAAFGGCALARTATNLVFGDGNPAAPLMFVGEAPGAEEDRQGLPFVGPSGRLLDRMLASIGLDRRGAFITNTVFWRPPGNRTPTTQEMAICMPFLERLIELVSPKVLVTLGGPAAKAVLAESAGVSRLRGRWFSYSTPRLGRPIPATALYHPAYLLRSPAQKRDAWRDLIALKRKLAAPEP